MSLNNSLNQLVPEIFDNPAWENKIILLQFVRIKGKSISIIEKNQDVLRTLEATNPANLFPFKNWKLTGESWKVRKRHWKRCSNLQRRQKRL